MDNEILIQILNEMKELKQGQAKLEQEVKSVKETAEANRASLVNIEMVQFKKIETALDIAVNSEDRMVDHEKRITYIEDEVQLIKAAL